jgi:ADP-ribose pyrophosphatase YjhB (NUDIX family)
MSFIQRLRDRESCAVSPPITPLVGCDTFIADATRTRVLLIRRADNGFWALPGGFVELDETPARCAARECLEETGLRVRITRLLGVFSSHCYEHVNYPHKGGSYCHILFLGETTDGAPRTTDEAREIGWFGARELPPMSDGHLPRVHVGFAALRDPSAKPHFE